MVNPVMYESLSQNPDKRCIRVFDVEPAISPGELNEQVRGSFRVVDLAAPGPHYFSALSYVWGEPELKPSMVQCGAHLIPLQENGLSALKHLRKKLDRFSIWIDALCINQDDEQEKENQIPLMGDIYSKCDNVYIWLGNGNAKTQRAMAYLREPKLLEYFDLARSIENTNGTPWSALTAWFAYKMEIMIGRRSWFPSSHRRRRKPKNSQNLTDVTFDDLDSLLDTDWTQRIWTYQELLLASNPIVVCGEDHILWLPFCFSLMFLEYTGVGYREKPQKLSSVSVWIRLAFSREYVQAISTGCSRSLQIYSCLMGRIRDFDDVFSGSWEGVKKRFFINVGTISLYSFVNFICISRNLKFANRNWSISKCLRSLWYGQLFGTFTQGLIELVAPIGKNWLKKNINTRTPNGASVGTLDLIDPLWHRQAKINHDKAFALRNILQRVQVTDIPMPNYAHPLDKVYESLNLNLAQTRRCRQMLAIASFNHLSGYPSWMPDWSKQADTFWLEDSTTSPLWASPIEDRLYDQIELGPQHAVSLEISDAVFVQKCFKFSRTDNNYHSDQKDIHLDNLEISLGLAKCRSRIRKSDQKEVRLPSAMWDRLTEVCCLAAPGLSEAQVRKWILFLRDNCKVPRENVFSSLIADSELIRTQISICNSLSENNRQLLWYWEDIDMGPVTNLIRKPSVSLKILLEGPWYGFGICSSAVRPGHLIVTIDGVSIRLIVALCGLSDFYDTGEGIPAVTARIVSPVRFRGRFLVLPPHDRDVERTTLTLL